MKYGRIAIALSFFTSAFALPCYASPEFSTLEPGKFREIDQDLQINIVFVGYHRGTGPRNINEAAFRSTLPKTYKSVAVIPFLYGLSDSEIRTGTAFRYNYNLVFAPTRFEDAFFSFVGSIAQPTPRTSKQDLYNLQTVRSLDVQQNHQINATATEKWLAENAPGMLGVDTSKYTIFLINWYDRPDFKFHTYISPDEPDADSGFNFGLLDGAEMIAGGGTAADDPNSGLGSVRRVWFYDLSAGPEFWTDNWNLTDADLNHDSIVDYRMPPVWEYGNVKGYRPFDNISGDLGAITRFVAINLLFTASPSYHAELPVPTIPHNIQLDINFYQVDATFDAPAFFKSEISLGALSRLQPQNKFSIHQDETRFEARAAAVFDCWAIGQPCYGARGYSGFSFYDLYAFHRDHLNQYLEPDSEDYQIPIFIYTTPNTDPYLSAFFGGVADDNYIDGTQQHIYVHQPRWISDFGAGLTYVVDHETGHHLSLGHPHDGFDSELNLAYSTLTGTYFAWSGDQSSTVMSYHGTNNDFSQFDRDNLDRNMVAAYINRANRLLPKILDNPSASEVFDLLRDADLAASSALSDYQVMLYRSACAKAQSAYQKVLTAGLMIRIPIEKQSFRAGIPREHGNQFRTYMDDGNELRWRRR